MVKMSGTPMGHPFYTSASEGLITGLAPTSATPPFLRMRRAEQAINAAVRSASDSKVVAFPVRRAYGRRRREG